MRFARRKVVGIAVAGIAAAAVTAFAPVGLGVNEGGGGGGYILACGPVGGYTVGGSIAYEGPACQARVARYMAYSPNTTGCYGAKPSVPYHAIFYLTQGNPYPIRWQANFCIDGTTHFSDVKPLAPSQSYMIFGGQAFIQWEQVLYK
jgi:hypothetical protein